MKNIRYQVLFSLFAVLLFAGCKQGSNEHLSQKKMKKILLDMNVAEAYSTIVKDSLHKPGMKNYDSLTKWYKEIFAHYNITQEQFTQSLNWYKAHPSEMDSMYSDMMPMVNKWQPKVTERKPR